jgi:hypothetical protein
VWKEISGVPAYETATIRFDVEMSGTCFSMVKGTGLLEHKVLWGVPCLLALLSLLAGRLTGDALAADTGPAGKGFSGQR